MKKRDRRRLVVSIVLLYRDAVIRTPGGRELLEEKKRQLRLAGVLKEGGDTDVFPALPLLQGEPGSR